MADEGRETQTMQESWVSVEEYKTGQLTHVRSSEEVAELLADAATEDKGSSEPLSVVETQFEEGKESQHCSTGSCLKSFVWTMLTPPFIISHLAAFLIGILIGRRMLS